MIATVRAEWRKLRHRPAFAVSAFLCAAVMPIGYTYLYWSLTHPATAAAARRAPQGLAVLYPAEFANGALHIAFPLGALVAIVLGALVSGSEYGWGTIKTLLTQRPGRLVNLAGRLVILGVWIGILTAVLYTTTALASVAVGLLQGHAAAWPPAADAVTAVGATWFAFFAFAMLGTVLGFVFRHAAAAVGVSVIYVAIVEDSGSPLDIDPRSRFEHWRHEHA